MSIEDRITPTCDISLKTWLNEKELMVYISLSQPKIKEARDKRGLPSINLMGRIMYERVAVDAWIKAEARRANTIKRR